MAARTQNGSTTVVWSSLDDPTGDRRITAKITNSTATPVAELQDLMLSNESVDQFLEDLAAFRRALWADPSTCSMASPTATGTLRPRWPAVARKRKSRTRSSTASETDRAPIPWVAAIRWWSTTSAASPRNAGGRPSTTASAQAALTRSYRRLTGLWGERKMYPHENSTTDVGRAGSRHR